jgi:hypothetical protein
MRPTIYVASFMLAAAPAAAQSTTKPDTAPPSPGAICADRDGDGRCDDTAVRGRDRDCSRDAKDAACEPPPLVGGACIDEDRDGKCDTGRKSRKARVATGIGGTIAGLFTRNVSKEKGGGGSDPGMRPPKPTPP